MIFVFGNDEAFTLSDLNDAQIPLKNELTFSATLVVVRFKDLDTAPPGLGAVSGFDIDAGFADHTSPSLLLNKTFSCSDVGARVLSCCIFLFWIVIGILKLATELQSDRVTDTQGYSVYWWVKFFCAWVQ